jgi:hypothetical protein
MGEKEEQEVLPMNELSQPPFTWRHFQSDIILLCVRWYLRSSLRYRDLEEMMAEHGLSVDHTTISRWVQHSAPELEKRCRPHLKASNDSWKGDETSLKIKKCGCPSVSAHRSVPYLFDIACYIGQEATRDIPGDHTLWHQTDYLWTKVWQNQLSSFRKDFCVSANLDATPTLLCLVIDDE